MTDVGLHTFEMAARMYITAKSAGVELRELLVEVASDFLDHSGYRPRREWPA